MKHQIKFLFISIFMLTICMSEPVKKKEFDNNQTIIELNPDSKDWNKEIKKIKDPELRKLLEELNIEFNNEKDYLRKEFKKKLEALRKEYLNKRQKLKKEYKKNDKSVKPKKINPNKEKTREKELENKIQELNKELEKIKSKNNKK